MRGDFKGALGVHFPCGEIAGLPEINTEIPPPIVAGPGGEPKNTAYREPAQKDRSHLDSIGEGHAGPPGSCTDSKALSSERPSWKETRGSQPSKRRVFEISAKVMLA